MTASNDLSQTAFTYDSLGHTVGSVQDGLAVGYTHDSLGNRRTCTCPSGYVVSTTYNALNRPASLSLEAGGKVSSLATFAYDGPGRLAMIARANGISTRVLWDGLRNAGNADGDFGWQQVSGIDHARADGGQVVDQRACAYDRSQNKILRAQTAPFALGGETITNSFAYDSLSRMTRYSRKNGALLAADYDYRLDGKGNRVVVSNALGETLYTRDATLPEPADFQMDQYTRTPFAISQTYDANGSLDTRRNSTAQLFYRHDYADRLVRVDALGGGGLVAPLVAFDYDALGRRVGKTVYASGLPSEDTQFVYSDGEDEDCDGTADDAEILETYKNGVVSSVSVLAGGAGGGAAAASYARLLSPPVALISAAGELTYTHTDDLGSVLALTDAGGNVLERCDYGDFGAPSFLAADGAPLVDPAGQPVTASPAGNPFLFRGMVWDGETGLFIEGTPKTPARYMDPKSGRFLSRQGGACSSGQCAYTFAGDNPWSLKKEEGGRHTPFHNKYRPQFAAERRNRLNAHFETGDVPTQGQFGALIDSIVSGGTARTHKKSGHVSLLK